ncbi:type II secretion system F family protein [Desulfovirgula thermocuniculi]|uniref:type II secretion system F family protein n=1 Tax=Desulfovirgula thermocuniculi TaxID=348842 RepID=UPI0004258518|nr:type II secretion system F family protein [Desulfovirgula thermocuniculi]
MPTYAYRARDREGKLVTGRLDAGGLREAARLLQAQGLLVVQLRPVMAAPKLTVRRPAVAHRVKLKELALFCRQLSTLVSSGVPLVGAMRILELQVEGRALREVVRGVVARLEEGRSLAESFGAYPQAFPELFVSMVEAGEVGGVLDEVLANLAVHFEREHELREKVKSALTYPSVVLGFAAVILTFMLTFVLPPIIGTIQNLGVPLPLPTRMLMAASDAARRWWFLLPLIAVAGALGLRRVRGSPRGRELWDRVILRLPIFGSLARKIIIARFARTLAALLRSGVAVMQALEVVKRTVGNQVMSRGLDRARESVREGQGLARPLEETGIFPPLVIRMVAVGEETGNLDALLDKVAAFYDQEVNITVGRLSGIIEPVLIVCLGGVVGFIVLSVLLPMFTSIMQGLGK